jgi:putative tricarboxylic transport membrane protein
MPVTADRVIVACIIVLATAYLYATAQIPSLEIGDPLGPKAFPRLLGIALFLTAGLLFLEIWRAPKAEPAKSEPASTESRMHLVVIAAVTVWTGVYYAVFEQLGYIIDTTVYLLALMAYFNRNKWLANTLTAVLFSLGSYVLFVKVLGVTLTRGILPF